MMLINIIYPLLITIIPIGLIYYKERTTTYPNVILWGILSSILSILFFKMCKFEINIIVILVTVLLSTLCNIGFIKEWINAGKMLKLFVVLGLFFFSSVIQIIPISIFNLDIENLTSAQDTYLTLFSDLILLIVLFILYWRELKNQLIEFKKNFYSFTDVGFKYWLIGLIVMVVSNLLINLLSPNAVAGNEQQVQDLIHGAPLASLICVGILAPIIEEITFRKAFYDSFSKKWLFVLVSGLVFGGLHVIFSFQSLWDFLYLIPYCSLGIAFGFIMIKTNNIFPSILLHIFHNTCLTILSIVSSLVIMVVLW